MGVRRAAQRRLEAELGIPMEQASVCGNASVPLMVNKMTEEPVHLSGDTR